MAEPGQFDAIVTAILEGKAPEHVRSAAARGALPLPRVALVRIYLTLREDPDASVRVLAESTLAGLDDPTILEVLADGSCAPEVLAHYADRALRDEALAEKIAFNPRTPTAALAKLAAGGNTAAIDLLLTNQERLLRQPAILERLMSNPALRSDQQGRLLELLARASEGEAGTAASGGVGGGGAEFEEAAKLLDVEVGELFSASEIVDAEEFEEHEDPTIRGAYQYIITLNSAQKAVLAMKGGREERGILIRDTNKVVALGVLKNPRLTDQEVESIAKMRNVTDEVLRRVAQNRDWSKSYAVVHALVTNPRTPQGLSANFIPRLNNRDLKMVTGSRDIPELIRRMAKRTLETRTQRQGSSFKR